MTAVMIGVDPHKGSHTAVAIDAAEEPLGELRVRASAGQAEKLVAWAADWPERTWAVEGAAGLITTAVCEPLCGSTPIITAAISTLQVVITRNGERGGHA